MATSTRIPAHSADHQDRYTRSRKTRMLASVAIAIVATLGWSVLSLSLGEAAGATESDARAFSQVADRDFTELQLPTLDSPAAVEAPAAANWDVVVDTTGHQAELDACLWVRMDFDGVVPIVGKHNYCGGDMVLDMVWGDRVRLTGLGLDGLYIVTGDRDAFSGTVPATATAGLTADVMLQTCYWNKSDGMRLVTLALLPETPRVVVGAS